jgi:iron complex outermembrane receptor protein
LQIVLGGRIQKFDLKQPTFTGNPGPYAGVKVESPETAITGDVSVAYFFDSSNTKLRGHIGNGYRAPSLYERFGSGYFSGFFSFYGDPRLMPEKSKSYEAGIDQYMLRNKVRASATWFYTDLTQLIGFANSFTGDPFGRTFGGYYNIAGGGISRGAEFSTQFTPTRKTSVTASYTYVNADQRSPNSGTNFYKVYNVSPHILSLSMTQWITPRLNATVDYYFLSNSFQRPFGATRVMSFAGPKKADLVVNYNLPINDVRSVDLYFKIENFGNYRYTDNGFLAPQAWGIGGIKFNF